MTKHKLTPIEHRFEDLVIRGECNLLDCWLWGGGLTSAGYGALGLGRREAGIVLAHRFSYEHYYETKIPSGMDVCHRCNNRACVNPNHLYVGTRKENMAQAKQDGRLGRPYRPWSEERRAKYLAQRAAAIAESEGD